MVYIESLKMNAIAFGIGVHVCIYRVLGQLVWSEIIHYMKTYRQELTIRAKDTLFSVYMYRSIDIPTIIYYLPPFVRLFGSCWYAICIQFDVDLARATSEWVRYSVSLSARVHFIEPFSNCALFPCSRSLLFRFGSFILGKRVNFDAFHWQKSINMIRFLKKNYRTYDRKQWIMTYNLIEIGRKKQYREHNSQWRTWKKCYFSVVGAA